jgi:hypothetical protein
MAIIAMIDPKGEVSSGWQNGIWKEKFIGLLIVSDGIGAIGVGSRCNNVENCDCPPARR